MIFHWKHLRTLILPVLALLVAGGLAGCASLLQPGTPTPTAPTATITDTIVWFPATNTPTPLPSSTPQPSLEPLPGIGTLLFADDFSDPALWNVSSGGQAASLVENGRLTLSLASGPLSIASLRSEPVLGDFYAVFTANPSLCRDTDQYGVLFRAAPGGTYYRFVLACNGTVRLERVRGGALEVLQNWLPSGDAPPGAPAVVQVGVWVSGGEMRFLLNGRFQFSLRDPVLHAGTLGFFARAGGTTPVLVSFTDLKVYAVSYISPTPSLTPSRTPSPTRTPLP